MRRVHWICIGLAVITLLVYWRVYGADFVNYDDDHYVYENPRVLGGTTPEALAWALRSNTLGNWHPLTWMSHMLDVQLYGLNPAGHHVTSVVIHTIAAVLLFLLLRRMTGSEWRSAIVAALFAWHPLHVESVAWISERKDTLSAVFWILTIWAYVRFTERASAGRYLLSMFVYLLALMSKPTTVTLPVVLLLLDFWPLKRLDRQTMRRRVLEKVPFLLLAIGVSIVTILAQKDLGAVGRLERYTLAMRASNAVVAYSAYLVKTFLPTSLATFYPHPSTLPKGAIPQLQLIYAAALLLVLTTVALWQWRSRPVFAAGWFWFIITLLPMIGLVQVGWQSRADRYTYIPHIGLFIALVWSWPAHRPRLGTAVASAALAVCLLITFKQTQYWKNSVTLFSHAAEVVPDNYLAHHNLGTALAEQGQIRNAADHFMTAVTIKPNYADAYANLGSALMALNRPRDAERQLRAALKLDPAHAEAHNNLANLLADRGESVEAERHYRAALAKRPNAPQTHHNLALLFAAEGRSTEAIDHWRRAIQLRPTYYLARLALAQELSRRGRGAESIEHFRAALQQKPDSPQAMSGLAWVLATDPSAGVRDIPQAIALATKARQLTGDGDPMALDALAAALAQSGDFKQAESTARHAGKIARRLGNEPLAAQIDKRADSYKAGRTFIMMPAPDAGE